jgi:hypothetical protein
MQHKYSNPLAQRFPKKKIRIKALSYLPFSAPVSTNQQTNIDCFIENLASICFSICGWALVRSVQQQLIVLRFLSSSSNLQLDGMKSSFNFLKLFMIPGMSFSVGKHFVVRIYDMSCINPIMSTHCAHMNRSPTAKSNGLSPCPSPPASHRSHSHRSQQCTAGCSYVCIKHVKFLANKTPSFALKK